MVGVWVETRSIHRCGFEGSVWRGVRLVSLCCARVRGDFLLEGRLTSPTSCEAKRREEPVVVPGESGPGFPSRERFPQSTGSVARVLVSVVKFVLQVLVVAAIRSVIDRLFP